MDNFLRKLFSKQKTKYNGYVPLHVIAKYLPTNPVIVEAGAFDGSDTFAMASRWPNGSIYAFEPVPTAYNKLVTKVEQLGNVMCFNMAVSNMVGNQVMHISAGPFGEQSSSLLTPKAHLSEHPDTLFPESIIVLTTTFDEWSVTNKINKVDFLWLDMQGHELAALKSSEKLLQSVQVIYTEVAMKELYDGCPLYPEVKQWLESKGFKAEIEELAWEDAGNVLFVKKK